MKTELYTVDWLNALKMRFFENLNETKKFAESLIAARLYRVDVGIGQINNETYSASSNTPRRMIRKRELSSNPLIAYDTLSPSSTERKDKLDWLSK